MARAISALALWKPNARRVISRSWVLTCSVRALLRPCWIAASIPGRCWVIVLASLTNGARRHRLAQASHASSNSMALS